MGEIKSTLDLVMERTRHLTMSDADRREQATGEFRTAVNRLVLKYLDGEIDVDSFHDHFHRLDGSASPSGKRLAAGEIIKRLDFSGDNGPLLDLLKHGVGLDVAKIDAILQNFLSACTSERRNSEHMAMQLLFNKGIAGSAVIPHLEADVSWAEKQQRMVERTRQELSDALEGGVI